MTIAGKSLQSPVLAPSHVQQTVGDCSHAMEIVWVSQEGWTTGQTIKYMFLLTFYIAE